MKFVCSQNEDHRCHRLLSVLQFVHGLGSGLDVFRSVEALEDHKGGLVVHWSDSEGYRPTEAQKALFHVAWATVGSEPFENVEHIVPEYPHRFVVEPAKVFTHGSELKCANCGSTQLHMLRPELKEGDRHDTLKIPFMCELCEGFMIEMCSGKGLVQLDVTVPEEKDPIRIQAG